MNQGGGEALLGADEEVLGRGSQEDERAWHGDDEVDNNMAEEFRVGLDGENGGDGVGGPGTDLGGEGLREGLRFAVEEQCFADGAAEPGEVD